MVLKNKRSEEDRAFWTHVEDTAAKVRNSPEFTKHEHQRCAVTTEHDSPQVAVPIITEPAD